MNVAEARPFDAKRPDLRGFLPSSTPLCALWTPLSGKDDPRMSNVVERAHRNQAIGVLGQSPVRSLRVAPQSLAVQKWMLNLCAHRAPAPAFLAFCACLSCAFLCARSFVKSFASGVASMIACFCRDFTGSAPKEKCLTDISEFHIPAGKVYVSPVIDCFDGKVVSWAISIRPDAQLVNTMLDAAIKTIDCISDRPVLHSDRGGHCRWPGWLSRIADAELTGSMSRTGCLPDNAACEGFFGRRKTEWFYPGNWQLTTTEQFTLALDPYIHWYNVKRIKMSLGARSPLEYRRSLGHQA